MKTTKQGVRDLGGNQKKSLPKSRAKDRCFHRFERENCYHDMWMDDACVHASYRCVKCGVRDIDA